MAAGEMPLGKRQVVAFLLEVVEALGVASSAAMGAFLVAVEVVPAEALVVVEPEEMAA